MVEVAAPVLSVGAVLIFIIIRLYYNQFYGGLGVNPNDVGLGYGNTLSTAAGFVLAAVALALYPPLMIAGIYSVVFIMKTRDSSLPESFRELLTELWPRIIRVVRLALPFAMVAILALTSVYFSTRADHYAEAVRSGRAVKFRGVPLSSLTVRATPALVSVVTKKGESPGLEALQSRSRQSPALLYLGQANGTIILYDSTTQEAVYVPISSIVLKLSNCQTSRSQNAACQEAVS
jgi:hypothetical protein